MSRVMMDRKCYESFSVDGGYWTAEFSYKDSAKVCSQHGEEKIFQSIIKRL